MWTEFEFGHTQTKISDALLPSYGKMDKGLILSQSQGYDCTMGIILYFS